MKTRTKPMGATLLAITVCQSTLMWLVRCHREQALPHKCFFDRRVCLPGIDLCELGRQRQTVPGVLGSTTDRIMCPAIPDMKVLGPGDQPRKRIKKPPTSDALQPWQAIHAGMQLHIHHPITGIRRDKAIGHQAIAARHHQGVTLRMTGKPDRRRAGHYSQGAND